MNQPEGDASPGRTAAFAVEAVQKYADLLRSYLSRQLRHPHDVDDVAQQVYMRLIRMSISPNDIKEPLAFIYAVAHKVLNSHWTMQYRRAHQFPAAGDVNEVCADLPSENLSDNLEDALDLRQQLMAHLKGLPPMHAACLVLFYRDGLTQKEVAQRLGLHPETVKTYLTDSKARLRKQFAAEGNPG